MDVNYEVWGTRDTWVDGEGVQLEADIKFAASTQDTYRELYTEGKLELNEMDLSAAYWGIGKGSIFNKPHYLSPYQKDGQTEVAIDAAADNIDRPLILSSNNFAEQQYISYEMRYAPHRTNVVGVTTMSYTGKVILDYNYQNLFIVPWVTCKAAGYQSTQSLAGYTLYEYIESEMFNTYPEVTAIQFQAYFGDGSVSRSEGSLGIISDIHFPESDLYYGTRTFWTQFGCSLLYNTTEYKTSGRSVIGQVNNTTTAIQNTVGDTITALSYKYSVSSDSTSVPLYYFDPDNDIWTVNKTGVYRDRTYWYEYPYIETTSENAETVRDYVLSQIAYLGFPFVYDPSLVSQGKIGDVGVYLPKFDEDGVTTGEYEEGENALTLPNAQWVDGRQGADYDPTKPPIRVPEDRGDIANVGASRRFRNPLKVWCLYNQNIDGLLSAINDIYQETADPDVQWQRDFQGSNPTDYIVGFYAILLNPPKTDNPQTFTLGPVDFDGSLSYYRYNFDAQNAGYFTFGTVALDGTGDYRPYGDFRDYAPYTQLEVYIPLCGTVELDPAYFVGHSIKIDMYYDIFTMSCVAAIYRVSSKGTTLYKTVNGTIGAQIPLLSRDMGTYQNTIKALESAHKQNENRLITSTMTAGIGAAITIGTGGAAMPALAGVGLGGMGLINTIEQGKLLDYQLDHTQPAIAQTGVAETQNSFCVGQLKAKINIKCAQPIENTNDAIYSNTVGNACCIATTVQYMSEHMPGLTICSDIKCGGIKRSSGESPTLEEINAIKQAFINGVYV